MSASVNLATTQPLSGWQDQTDNGSVTSTSDDQLDANLNPVI